MKFPEYLKLLDNTNVEAFLVVIRVGEGTVDENGYRRLFGGDLFDSFSDHPRIKVTKKLGGKPITSTAAGAYQFLSRTWDECKQALGLPDFSPASQDVAALFLIDRRKALEDVVAGRVELAIKKCAKEWASLPGSPYGQPTKTLRQCLETYIKAGGTFDPKEKEQDMAPFIAAAIPALIQAAPSLIRLFGESPQSEKNAKAAEVVADIAKTVTGETTIEGAVGVIQNDPEKAAAYREAVHQSTSQITGLLIQAGEADEKARSLALDRNLQLGKATGGRWLWLLGGVAGLTVTFSFLVVWRVLFGAKEFSEAVQMLLLGQVVLAGFALVMAFLFGTNLQNRISNKDQQ